MVYSHTCWIRRRKALNLMFNGLPIASVVRLCYTAFEDGIEQKVFELCILLACISFSSAIMQTIR